jgi:acyl carrier protein
MVPAETRLLESLPLTPSGKVDALALPVSEQGAVVAQGFVAPEGELEEMLAAVWAQALGVSRVGADDNFFALRGHSLLATQVIARIGEEIGIEIPLQCLFEAPTVAGMARSIDALRWAAGVGHSSGDDDAAAREVVRL